MPPVTVLVSGALIALRLLPLVAETIEDLRRATRPDSDGGARVTRDELVSLVRQAGDRILRAVCAELDLPWPEEERGQPAPRRPLARRPPRLLGAVSRRAADRRELVARLAIEAGPLVDEAERAVAEALGRTLLQAMNLDDEEEEGRQARASAELPSSEAPPVELPPVVAP